MGDVGKGGTTFPKEGDNVHQNSGRSQDEDVVEENDSRVAAEPDEDIGVQAGNEVCADTKNICL